MGWGLSLVGVGSWFLCGGVLTPEGFRLPSVRACDFLLWYSFWRWPGWPSVSKKEKTGILS